MSSNSMPQVCDSCKKEFIGCCRVQLQPCGHGICFCCFHRRWAAKLFPLCPCADCRTKVEASSIISSCNGDPIGEAVRHAKEDPELFDKIRTWGRKVKDETNAMLIFAVNKDGRQYADYPVEVDAEFQLDNQSRENLMKIFVRCLHPILMDELTSDKENGLPEVVDMDPPDFEKLPQQDQSLLFPCLMGLATGSEVWKDGSRPADFAKSINTHLQSCARAAFVAKEMLMHLKARRRIVGRFQKFFINLIESFAGQGRVMLVETLSKFRLSASTAYSERANHDRILEHMKAEETFGPDGKSKFNFYTFSKDNFDLKKKGRNPGNDSWVLILIYCDDRETLKQLGFYENDEAKRIDREHHRSKDELQAYDICDPTYYEWEQLSFSVLELMYTVITLSLPSLEQAKKMAKCERYDWEDYSDIPRDCGVDLEHPRTPRVSNGKRLVHHLSARRDREEDDEEPACENFDDKDLLQLKGLVHQNNMVVDFPLHQNLQKTDTVQGLLHNFHDYVDEIEEKDEAEEDASGEAPVQHVMIPTSGDGAPASAEFNLKNWDSLKDLESQRFFRLQPFAGGFHWMKETLERRASSLVDIVEFFVKSYRETDNMAKQVMFPHDPRQAEEEMPFYLAAFYRAAADEYAILHDKDAVSPAQVHRHILQRAKEEPLALAVLQDLRFLHLFVLFQWAERTRSADLFIAAIRLILPFLITANAPNYISIATETLTWWELASDAEKVLFENCVLTRKTAKGRPAYLDRVQEMMNTFFRFKVGHHVTEGIENKMLQAACSVKHEEGVKRDIDNFRNRKARGHKTQHTTKTTRDLRSYYVKLYIRIREINLWGKGPIIWNDIESDPEALQIPGSDNRLDSNVLYSYTTGESRMIAYVEKFILDGPSVTRPTTGEDGVPISFLGVSLENNRKKKEATKTLKTGVERAAVEKAAKLLGFKNGGPKKLIWAEIQDIASSWKDPPKSCEGRLEEIKKGNPKVEDLADCLVFLRQRFFDKCKTKKSEILKAIDEELRDKSSTTPESRATILESQIFTLLKDEVEKYSVEIPLSNNKN